MAKEKSNSLAIPEDLRMPADICLKALADWSLFPQLLNIGEAAWLMSIPVQTIYSWHASGRLRGVAKRVGKHLRFDRDALMRFWQHENKKTTK